MNGDKLILDYVLANAASHPDRIYLTQPVGGGKVVDYTWGQVVDQAKRMAAHLQSRGLQRGARVAILSKNCAHFFIAELAIWIGGYTSTAIFPTETAATVRYVLEHSEASLLFVGKLDLWEQQKSGVPEGLACVALPLAPKTNLERWDDIIARTEPLATPVKRTADELAILLYTSGSTGQPKGVMTTFGAFTRAAEGIVANTRERTGPTAEARMLSYLPLAHSFERSWVEGSSLVDGNMRIFFTEALETFQADLQRARPTLFISVPRLWLKFQQGVFAKMPPEKLNRLLGIPILGKIVAKKVIKGLGLDAVVRAGSGSAPLPADLIRWYRRLGLNLVEGYGMSEDNSYSHTSDEKTLEPGWVGNALPGVQVKISADGEILIKSPGQFSGYYKQPELTAASFTEDGFFKTGDRGELRKDGLLRITGRAKEIFKTAKGEYVAPAPIENGLNSHPMIELSLVSGSSQRAPFAMVVLADTLRPRLKEAAVREQVQGELEALRQRVNQTVADYSKLEFLVVLPEPWTVENGQLTPTMKIRRARIEDAVGAKVEAWYASGQKVVWA